ncbi:unnamed protein product, partial [Vitis vinifera]|uniref:Uncharacterized protein n=1 Tax=Vitis vinifera TaxID=29760 RepID=D7U7A6_VITVI
MQWARNLLLEKYQRVCK